MARLPGSQRREPDHHLQQPGALHHHPLQGAGCGCQNNLARLKPGQTIELLIDQDNILQQLKIA
jgi:hypothetical protein